MKHIAAAAIATAFTLCAAASGAAQQAGTTQHAMHTTATTVHAQTTASTTHHASSATHASSTSRSTHARVSEARARRTALGAVAHGRVRSHSLRHADGKLVYVYSITVPGQSGTQRVTVDATTGAIVSNEHVAAAATTHHTSTHTTHTTTHTSTHHKR